MLHNLKLFDTGKDSYNTYRWQYIDAYKNHKRIFEKYSGDTNKYITAINNDIKNVIEPLEKQIKKLERDYNYSFDGFDFDDDEKPSDKLLYILNSIVNEINCIFNNRVQLLTIMEKEYNIYLYNSKLLRHDGKK